MLEYIVLSGRNKIYAIIESGGKQYKVAPGKTVDVERLNVAEGEAVELDRVLLIAEEDKVTFGNPVIEGAKVTATSKGEFKDDKVIVFKYKPKVRYRKKTGHRHIYTTLAIDSINPAGAVSEKPKRARRSTKKEVTEDGA